MITSSHRESPPFFDTPQWTDVAGKSISMPKPPTEGDPGAWELEVTAATDDAGWQYATAFKYATAFRKSNIVSVKRGFHYVEAVFFVWMLLCPHGTGPCQGSSVSVRLKFGRVKQKWGMRLF